MALPYNPEVRELVSAKKRKVHDWHERGYLPHRDEPGLTQFITFHLADSYPKTLQSEWAGLLLVEDHRERRKQLEGYLDKGRGDCHLRDPRIGRLVDEALRFYHGKRYDLQAWVVMPNHVHALFKVENISLSKIVRDLKGYTAREANNLLDQRGAFWAPDYFDTYMRDEEHGLKARHYIENNPSKAFLVRDPKEWPWSSSRFRDEFGKLRF